MLLRPKCHLKKTECADDEIPIYDEAVIHKRSEYWQMRMWLGTLLIWIAAALTVMSMLYYLRKAWPAIAERTGGGC